MHEALRYFKKSLSLKGFGVEGFEGLAALIPDTVAVNPKTSFLEVQQPEDTTSAQFLRITEAQRRGA